MPKRIVQGRVVSNKNNQTVVVLVERRYTHPVLKKTVRTSKRYHAHDEANAYQVGDEVRLEETRPISKLKRWRVLGRVGADGSEAASDAPAGDAPAADEAPADA